MNNFRQSVVAAFLMLVVGGCASQPGISSRDIDSLVTNAMQEFSVPGVAVGVVKDGVIVHASGYGVRELGLADPVNLQTMFRIASTTKAITTASLAILVDDGKLSWDDKVVDYIPEFALYDPWVTAEFTVADLLTHRSGLEGAAGDLMLWPKPNKFTRADLITGLTYFKPESAFRTEYAYDNLLYIVAGELVPAVTGMAWSDFVEENIFDKLGTSRCFAGRIPQQEMQNLAAPHTVIDDELRVVERNRARAEVDVAAAAGGVRCSLEDMLKWTQLQLARGELPDGSRVFSAEQSRIMWSPHTIQSVSSEVYERDRTHFRAYALGWRLADVEGYKQVAHTGSYTGFRSHVILVPELDLGVVIMLNASANAARGAIAQGIIKPYLGVHGVDWLEYYTREDEPAVGAVAEEEPEVIDFRNGSVDASLTTYAGLYTDPWFGDVSIEIIDGDLWFVSEKSPKMKGRLWPYEGHTFYAYWADQTLEADAFVTFEIDVAGNSLRMDVEQVSEEADWDFTDLDLSRVTEE
jgi:CubicO group peptidase (beta-lactamase class C family)